MLICSAHDHLETIVAWWLSFLFGGCGWLLGKARGDARFLGFLICFAFGPLGVFLVLLSPRSPFSVPPVPLVEDIFGAAFKNPFSITANLRCAQVLPYVLLWLLMARIPSDFGFHARDQHPVDSPLSYDEWVGAWQLRLKYERATLRRERKRVAATLLRYGLRLPWHPAGWCLGILVFGYASKSLHHFVHGVATR